MQRLEVIDVLRGFALFGIIIVHFLDQFYGGTFNGKFENSNDFDLAVWDYTEFLISGKFYMIFSFLFGVSFFIQRTAIQKRRKANWLFVWRLLILFSLGLIHALNYRGDILYTYALMGLPLIIFEKISNKQLILLGVILAMNVPSLGYRCIKLIFTKQAISIVSNNKEDLEIPTDLYYKTVKMGSYSEVLKKNMAEIIPRFKYRVRSGKMTMILGLFLLGLVMGRTGMFTNSDVGINYFIKALLMSIVILFVLLFIHQYINYLPDSKSITDNFYWVIDEAIKDFTNFFMALFYENEGIVFHASAVEYQGKAHVFA